LSRPRYPAPVKADKSRQIAANGTAVPRASGRMRSAGGWYFSGPMRYDFCGVGETAGEIRNADAGV